MRILEQCCIGKLGDSALNEDALVVTDNYVAVIDGATGGCTEWGKPGGLLARELLSDYLKTAGSSSDGFGFIEELNSVLYEAQKHNLPLFAQPNKRLMASVLVYSRSVQELWSYGDCQYSVNHETIRFGKAVDKLNAEVRSYVNEAALLNGISVDELLHNDLGADAIQPLLTIQPSYANVDHAFGYPILDGGRLLETLFLSQRVHIGDTVIMATDGYPVLGDTLEKCEEQLTALRARDPLLIRECKSVKAFYPQLQSFDDRTFIRFTA